MDTYIRSPYDLFQSPIRYTIPQFQRRYVWDQEEQWEPLWEDVRNTAENYLEELDRSDNDPVVAEDNTTSHFLGAVVIQQVPVRVRDIQRWQVIDGQQRMTTLQLMLDAIQYVFEDLGLDGEAERLSDLVINRQRLGGRDENEVFKLWPTTGDREAFRHAMHNGLATNEFEDSLIVQAHEYFQTQAKDWLNSDPDSIQRNAEALEASVTGLIQMVVIQLTSNDNPYIIFETLNARGTPLLESDLVKNYVMLESDELSQASIWGNLDDDWWSKEVVQGRLLRPRKDMLLNYWLAMCTGTDIRNDRVFRDFRILAEDRPIYDVMAGVRRDLGNYRRFEEGPRTYEEETFHYRISRVMGIGVITPALLLILRARCEEERIKALQALESFLIRSMICRGSTSAYNRLTLELVGELQKHGLDNIGGIVAKYLKEQTAYSIEWPNDRTLENSMVNRGLYRALNRGRLRLVLEAIEEKLRTSMSEQLEVPKELTIEHVMPQSWEHNWPLPDGADEDEDVNKRNNLVHTIGNLTLITGGLNSTLSNAPWKDKRKTLGMHSILHLNKDLLEESHEKDWDEDFIEARSKRMAKLVAEVWPGPDSPVWD